MAIKPGKCPFVNGEPNCPPYTEKDCIEVLKVYDQCAAEELLGGSILAPVPIPPGSTCTCSVVPGSAVCFFAGFGDFNPPYYRPVKVVNRVSITGEIRDVNGNLVTTYTTTLQALTQAFMWAPLGTLVQCQILDVGDCECGVVTDPVTGDQLIWSQVKVCKEIQVKALVKLLVPSYGFCELDPCNPPPQPFVCPPDEPLYPPQRCQSPPVITLLEAIGTGIPNVDVTLTRKVDGTTVSITKKTALLTGIASFAEVGGFAGGLDTISFTDPITAKTITFPVPLEFTDTATPPAVHDSTTVCTITFQRTAIGLTTFNVFLDTIQLATPIDP
ncbi:hypothetical protein HY02_08970 [Peptococcaceae bacterium SCADC1_2_3]|jgi:hypothetical protein|nr:hypothetical protein DK28_0200840 [Peptococcaceae bacterium SCADC1_2_3]KFI34902.1 hypothetical protein HY00_08820 [Peptococcaceae bacterium SCADC1_2_3]KFI38058.1 hypothetical protein HY02_08970 [Peptococcaceae bacterium SCADC1_2_3]HBQ28911.1 hypothetical protein [Desulfotomaculum sp.]HCJ79086.1 hypothetical protein [Desulfotomaculum sp.]